LLRVVWLRFGGGFGLHLEVYVLKIEELQNLRINPGVAREAYAHAEKRLADTLEAKKTFEQKAFFLFNAYVAASLAAFGVVGALYRGGADSNMYAFLLCGVILVIGAGLFLSALLDSDYGAMGSDPALWLKKGTIDGEDSVLPLMLAYITHHHKNRIQKSSESNDKKSKLIRLGLFAGLVATVVLALLVAF
jgi:hypothetical protein